METSNSNLVLGEMPIGTLPQNIPEEHIPYGNGRAHSSNGYRQIAFNHQCDVAIAITCNIKRQGLANILPPRTTRHKTAFIIVNQTPHRIEPSPIRALQTMVNIPTSLPYAAPCVTAHIAKTGVHDIVNALRNPHPGILVIR